MSDLLTWGGLAVAAVVILAIGQVLGDLVSEWLVRREEAELQQLDADERAFQRKFFSDPAFAIAHLRQHFPDDPEIDEMVERIKKLAAQGRWRYGREQ